MAPDDEFQPVNSGQRWSLNILAHSRSGASAGTPGFSGPSGLDPWWRRRRHGISGGAALCSRQPAASISVPQTPLPLSAHRRGPPLKLLKASAIGILLLSVMSLPGCGTTKRFITDVGVGLSSPVLVVVGGSTDAVSDIQEVDEALDAGPFAQVAAFPLYFLWHGTKHLVYSAVHVGDALLCPLYAAAELHPAGPEIAPLDFYEFWPPWFGESKEGGTDFESGESVDR